MRTIRRISVALVGAALGAGLLGVSAPANADTTWCPACAHAGHYK